MTDNPTEVLRRLLHAQGFGPILQAYSPSPDDLLSRLLAILDKVAAEYHARAGSSTPFTLEALVAESSRNPHKVRAFFQATRLTNTPEMLVMVWRILEGFSIQEIKMNYQKRCIFEFVVVLSRPESQTEPQETYRSTTIFDARLLRHFGTATAAGQPSFNGFFPLDQDYVTPETVATHSP